jgi:exodeoxyribonuclease VII small subunit
MKTNLTYSEAFSKLENLVGQLEEGEIPLDKLSLKVKQANELIAICEKQLRGIKDEVKEASKDANAKTRKKK